MIVRLHSQYESVGETATLYLSGSLRPGEEEVLDRVLGALPSHIRVVRVDLGALERIDHDVVDTVRHVLARRRMQRGGAYHLSARLTAAVTCAPRELDRAAVAVAF